MSGKIDAYLNITFKTNNKQILNYEDELVEKVKYFKKLKVTLEIVKPCSKSAVRYMSET